MFAVRGGADTLGHLKLEHKGQAFPFCSLTQPADQQRGGDIIGQVGDNLPWGGAKGCQVFFECISLYDVEPLGEGRGQFLDNRDRAWVQFHRIDMACAGCQQGACQPAGAGADLNYMAAIQRASQCRDMFGNTGVQQKVLAQRLARIQTVTADDIGKAFQCSGQEITFP